MAALRKDPRWRTRRTSASACPTAAWATTSRAPSGPSATTSRTSRRTARWTWSAASWSPATPISRSWAPTTWAPSALCDTANLLGIAAASPDTAAQLKKSLPQSSYGQGQVVASPFQMARVAATVANGGAMPQGRWITDETNARTSAAADRCSPRMPPPRWAEFMREVVTAGHRPRAAAAQRRRWPARPAPPNWPTRPRTPGSSASRPTAAAARKIAFSVLVENGVYGGTAAAPAAAEIVNAAVKVGPDPVGYSHESLFGIEKTIERGFREWTERVFGPAESDELLLVHRAILEEIEGKVQIVARGRRVFPYSRVTVTLVSRRRRPPRLYQTAFGEGGRLESRHPRGAGGRRVRSAARLLRGGDDRRRRATGHSRSRTQWSRRRRRQPAAAATARVILV